MADTNDAHYQGGVTLSTLLDGWAKETKPVQSTLDLRKTYVAMFVAFIGRDDALSVQRPDIVTLEEPSCGVGQRHEKLSGVQYLFLEGLPLPTRDGQRPFCLKPSSIATAAKRRSSTNGRDLHAASMPNGGPRGHC